MQFLKKNYEKVLLAAIGLVALGTVAFLPILVSSEHQRVEDAISQFTKAKRKPMPELALTNEQVTLARAQTLVTLDLVTPPKIFNSERWQLDPNQRVIQIPNNPIEKLQVTKQTPLHFVIAFETADVSPGMTAHYAIGLTHEAALAPRDRAKKTTYAAIGQTTNGFTIQSAQGPEDDPTGVTMQLESGETVSITKDQPYKRVEGFMLDLYYQPEGKRFINRRVNDTISYAGDFYKIIDIKESELVLLQQSNQKQWIKAYSLTNSTSTATSPLLNSN